VILASKEDGSTACDDERWISLAFDMCMCRKKKHEDMKRNGEKKKKKTDASE
jgi:hypothetical protein